MRTCFYTLPSIYSFQTCVILSDNQNVVFFGQLQAASHTCRFAESINCELNITKGPWKLVCILLPHCKKLYWGPDDVKETLHTIAWWFQHSHLTVHCPQTTLEPSTRLSVMSFPYTCAGLAWLCLNQCESAQQRHAVQVQQGNQLWSVFKLMTCCYWAVGCD